MCYLDEERKEKELRSELVAPSVSDLPMHLEECTVKYI